MHSPVKHKNQGKCSHVQIIAIAVVGFLLFAAISSAVAYVAFYVLQKSDTNNTFSINNLVHENTNNDEDWVVIQRRKEGNVNFTRSWEEYKDGFGFRSGDFWFGNDNIHILTQKGYNRLSIKFTTFDGISYSFEYDHFNMSGEMDHYRLSTSGYHPGSGSTMRDCLHYHNRIPFSTYDRDNDDWWDNCAVLYRGGWWYDYCQEANLNGEYRSGGEYRRGEMIWCGLNEYIGIRYTQMMLKKIR